MIATMPVNQNTNIAIRTGLSTDSLGDLILIRQLIFVGSRYFTAFVGAAMWACMMRTHHFATLRAIRHTCWHDMIV
jgi:hypothetical protein